MKYMLYGSYAKSIETYTARSQPPHTRIIILIVIFFSSPMYPSRDICSYIAKPSTLNTVLYLAFFCLTYHGDFSIVALPAVCNGSFDLFSSLFTITNNVWNE